MDRVAAGAGVVWSLTAWMSDGVDGRYFCFLLPHPHRDLPFLQKVDPDVLVGCEVFEGGVHAGTQVDIAEVAGEEVRFRSAERWGRLRQSGGRCRPVPKFFPSQVMARSEIVTERGIPRASRTRHDTTGHPLPLRPTGSSMALDTYAHSEFTQDLCS